MKLDELIGFYKAVWARDMKVIMDVLNTLFHMPTLKHSPEGPCYYAAWALEQASGKDRSLLFYQESDFTELRSTLSALSNTVNISFLLTWKSGIFMVFGKFLLVLTIQKKKMGKVRLHFSMTELELKDYLFLYLYFIPLSLKRFFSALGYNSSKWRDQSRKWEMRTSYLLVICFPLVCIFCCFSGMTYLLFLACWLINLGSFWMMWVSWVSFLYPQFFELS